MSCCFVPGCSSARYGRRYKEGLTFHVLRKEWLQAIGRPLDYFVAHEKICSEHFRENEFERVGIRRKIKPGVIPSQNIYSQPNISVVSRSISESDDTHGRNWVLAASRKDLLDKVGSVHNSHQFSEGHSDSNCIDSDGLRTRLLPNMASPMFPSVQTPFTDHTYSIVGRSSLEDSDCDVEEVSSSEMTLSEAETFNSPGHGQVSCSASESRLQESSTFEEPISRLTFSVHTQTSESFYPETKFVKSLLTENNRLYERVKFLENQLALEKDGIINYSSLGEYKSLACKFCKSKNANSQSQIET